MESPLRLLLEDVREALTKRYGARMVDLVLYGSQARGEAGPDSDVDILVLLSDPVEVVSELKGLAPLQMDLLDRHEIMVSIQPYSIEEYRDRESPFLEQVRQDAISLL